MALQVGPTDLPWTIVGIPLPCSVALVNQHVPVLDRSANVMLWDPFATLISPALIEGPLRKVRFGSILFSTVTISGVNLCSTEYELRAALRAVVRLSCAAWLLASEVTLRNVGMAIARRIAIIRNPTPPTMRTTAHTGMLEPGRP